MSEEVFRLVVATGVILACVAFLVQAGIIFALYRLTRKAQERIQPVVDRLEPLAEQGQPIVTSARNILAAVEAQAPRINEVSQNIVAASQSVREQAAHLGTLLDDVNARASKRLADLDHTVDHAVEQMEQTGQVVKGAVLKPLREVNAIVAGVRAALFTYAQGGQRPSVDHATQDEEMFI